MLVLLSALLATVLLVTLLVRFSRQTPAAPPTVDAVAAEPDHGRRVELETRLRSAFDLPTQRFGDDLFTSFAIWQQDRETRMELKAADPFERLNEFTRCIIVRHLWRALERLAEGTVVVLEVDAPTTTMKWSRSIDAKFHDHGVDPLRLPLATVYGEGPQFAKG